MRKVVETTLAVVVFLLVFAAVPAMAQTQLNLTISNAPSPPVVGFVSLEGAHTSGFQVPVRYPAGTKLTVSWDPYTAAELAANLADRYEVTVTGPTPGVTSVAIPTVQFALPTLAPGSYTVAVKGCNTTACGNAATLPFIVDPVVPGAPRGITVTPSPDQLVSLPQAGEIAHAYSTILQGRRLADTEMTWLVARYVNSSMASLPLSRPVLMTFLDGEAANLLQR